MVDDSPAMNGEIFNLEEFEGADWVLIADEVPVDEARRDELLELPGLPRRRRPHAVREDLDDDEDVDDVDEDEETSKALTRSCSAGSPRVRSPGWSGSRARPITPPC